MPTPTTLPAVGSQHTNAHTGEVFKIVEAPEGWSHRDAEREGLLLVSTQYPGELASNLHWLVPYNLHHLDIAEHFPSLASWLVPPTPLPTKQSALGRALKARGFDYRACSSDGLSPGPVRRGEHEVVGPNGTVLFVGSPHAIEQWLTALTPGWRRLL